MPETLASVSTGRPFRVMEVRGGRELRTRLAALGVLPGVMLQVLLRGPLGGPVLVEVAGARLAIGRRMAHRVLVEP